MALPPEKPKQITPSKQSPAPAGAKGSSPDPKQPPMPKQEKKPQPTVQKDESLKYTMTYANGGFNNGVELKPGKDGKIELSITIYGGGESKSLGISRFSPQIEKLVKAYQVGAETQQGTEDITKGLKDYFSRVNQVLSMKIIQILQETDTKIQASIKETFKEVK